MRAFIGLALPGECRASIARALSPLMDRSAGVAWTPERNLHVTMRFLGEIAPGRVGEVGDRMAEAAREVPPFEFSVEGPGGFPSLRDPRVLWVGVREPLELVRKLHQNMENALAAAGFPREGRAFHPHVTVGRVRRELPPGWAAHFAGILSGKRFGVVKAGSYQLYESRLSPAGSVYTMLRDVPFGGETAATGQEEQSR
jgi:RNA 2',3'-cyclic 3'-phosphodiesterase